MPRKDIIIKQMFCVPWQTAKVFISSTFRDMHAERDHLIKVVFPEIKSTLELYNIEMIDIDLRWGITKEQAATDSVLELCLQLIDESRPFFISLLGERYGWIPEIHPDRSLVRYGRIQNHKDKSITELEILYGVLDNSLMKGYAFFYLRDPESLSKVPQNIREEIYTEKDESLKLKLQLLKDRIINSGYPVYINYPAKWDEKLYDKITKIQGKLTNLIEFGDRVKMQLLEAIQKEYSLPENLDDEKAISNFLNTPYRDRKGKTIPLEDTDYKTLDDSQKQLIADSIKNYREGKLEKKEVITNIDIDKEMKNQRREIENHDRAIQRHGRTYIHRQKLEDQLIHYAENDDNRILVLRGEDGIGKSSLLAWFYRDYALDHDKLFVLPHFVSASPASSNLYSIILRICIILKHVYNIDILISKYINRTEILSKILRAILSKIPESERIIILIDDFHLIQDKNKANPLTWLPCFLPPNIKIVISISQNHGLYFNEQLSISEPEYAIIQMPKLDNSEKEKIINLVPSISAKTLDYEQQSLLLSNKATENPLYLITAIEELRYFGSFVELSQRIKGFPNPDDIKKGTNIPNIEIIKQVIERLANDFDAEVVKWVLSAIVIGQNGIFRKELEIMVSYLPNRQDLHAILHQIKMYIFKSGELINYSYYAFYEGVTEMYLHQDNFRKSIHEKMARIIETDLNTTKSTDFLITKSREAVTEFSRQLGLKQDNPFLMYDLDRFTQYKRNYSALLFHLSEAGLWEEVAEKLIDLEIFVRLWSTDHQAVIDLWKMLELNSYYSAAFAYNFILEAPDQYKYYLHPIGLILFYLGYTEQSRILFKWLFQEIQINGATDLVQEENPGDFYIFVKQYNIALKIYTLERAIAKGMGDEFGTQFYLQRQADVYLKMNEPAKALNTLIKEIDNKDTLISVYDKIEFLEKAVEITTVMDAPEQSLIFLYTIEKMAQEYRLNDKLQYCFGKQSEIYIKQENYEKAMELLKKQEALCRK